MKRRIALAFMFAFTFAIASPVFVNAAPHNHEKKENCEAKKECDKEKKAECKEKKAECAEKKAECKKEKKACDKK